VFISLFYFSFDKESSNFATLLAGAPSNVHLQGDEQVNYSPMVLTAQLVASSENGSKTLPRERPIRKRNCFILTSSLFDQSIKVVSRQEKLNLRACHIT
jgi:hypothetical protein